MAVDTDIFDDQGILARTLWGEARSLGWMGMHSVANVVMNRVKHGGWWGTTVRSVCLKPEQFSCWNADDLNRPKLFLVGLDDMQFEDAIQIAADAIDLKLPDITGGADHYIVHGTQAKWAANLTPVAHIGSQDFYITV